MAKIGQTCFDNKGESHASPELATISDLVALFGRMNGPEGMADGVARLILERRKEIEQAFAEHDAMVTALKSKDAIHATDADAPRDSHLLNSATADR